MRVSMLSLVRYENTFGFASENLEEHSIREINNEKLVQNFREKVFLLCNVTTAEVVAYKMHLNCSFGILHTFDGTFLNLLFISQQSYFGTRNFFKRHAKTLSTLHHERCTL